MCSNEHLVSCMLSTLEARKTVVDIAGCLPCALLSVSLGNKGTKGGYLAGTGGAGGPDGVECAARAGQRHGGHLHIALPQALP